MFFSQRRYVNHSSRERRIGTWSVETALRTSCLTFFSLRKTTSSLGQICVWGQTICVWGQTIAPGITHLPHPPTALHHWDNWFTFLSSSLPLSYGQSNLSQEANMNCKFISAVLNCAALWKRTLRKFLFIHIASCLLSLPSWLLRKLCKCLQWQLFLKYTDTWENHFLGTLLHLE